jgi:hypothetical protein
MPSPISFVMDTNKYPLMLLGQNWQERTPGIGQSGRPGPLHQDRTVSKRARTGQLDRDSQKRTARTRQPGGECDCQERTFRTG